MCNSSPIKFSIDPDSWNPMDEDVASVDPIGFHSEEEPYKSHIHLFDRLCYQYICIFDLFLRFVLPERSMCTRRKFEFVANGYNVIYVSILTSATGGVTASFAMSGVPLSAKPNATSYSQVLWSDQTNIE